MYSFHDDSGYQRAFRVSSCVLFGLVIVLFVVVMVAEQTRVNEAFGNVVSELSDNYGRVESVVIEDDLESQRSMIRTSMATKYYVMSYDVDDVVVEYDAGGNEYHVMRLSGDDSGGEVLGAFPAGISTLTYDDGQVESVKIFVRAMLDRSEGNSQAVDYEFDIVVRDV